MGSGYYCKGFCERFPLKKRADYPKGDVFCVPCGKAYPLEYTKMLLEMNGKFKICPCCHSRTRTKGRYRHDYKEFQERFDYLNTFEDLGMPEIRTERANRVHESTMARKKQQYYNYYQAHKEERLAYGRKYYYANREKRIAQNKAWRERKKGGV